MKLTPADLMKLLRHGDLVFTEHGNFRIKEKEGDVITLEQMGGTR